MSLKITFDLTKSLTIFRVSCCVDVCVVNYRINPRYKAINYQICPTQYDTLQTKIGVEFHPVATKDILGLCVEFMSVEIIWSNGIRINFYGKRDDL